MRPEYKEFAQKMRDEGAPDYVIYLADHAQEIEDAMVLKYDLPVFEEELAAIPITHDIPDDAVVYEYRQVDQNVD